MANLPLFGVNVDPALNAWNTTLAQAQLADKLGYDMVLVQDHPYNRHFFETWTLVTALTMRTERIHVGTNVANLPLRPPAMLAKAAATLDVLSGGRVELGLGAGALWQAVEAFGGQARTPGEAYGGFEDALHIIKGLWANAGKSFSYAGKYYHVKGAQFGPAPAHPIRLWVGGYGPKMLRLTGKMGDGLLVSNTYTPPEQLPDFNRRINEGAAEAGRQPTDIRRGYNVMGVVEVGQYGREPGGLGQGVYYGTPQVWTDKLLDLYHNYGQDAFVFSAVGDNDEAQITAFAQEVMPAVRAGIAAAV